MKQKVSIYSQNLAFKVGGAESCIFSMYKNLNNQFEINLWSGFDSRLVNFEKHNYTDVRYINIYHIDNLIYAKLVVNIVKTFLYFKPADSEILIGNCSSGVGAILKSAFLGRKTIYYVHEEYSLNRYTSYIKPISFKSKLLRIVKNCVDYPFYLLYCALNKLAIKKSDAVFANSNFIKNELDRSFHSDAIVIYPFTKTKENKVYNYNQDGFITMVGDGFVKGVDTFRAIAKLMPDKKFRIVAKSSTYQEIGNLVICPFFDNIDELYRTTSIFLVPSVWLEAFGKVSIEASSRGIPVFVSRRGALPETVLSDYYVIDEYLNPEAWRDKISNFEADISLFEKDKIIKNSYKFDESEDTKKLIEILNRLSCYE